MNAEQKKFWKILQEPYKKNCGNCVYNAKQGHPANIDVGGTRHCQPNPCWDPTTNTYTQWIWDNE